MFPLYYLQCVMPIIYCFTYIDVGSYGKSSDAGIFRNSTLFEKLCDGSLDIPPPASIANSNEKYPYIIVGDEAFPLSENLLRPFGGRHLTKTKQKFNYILSRARRYIQCLIFHCRPLSRRSPGRPACLTVRPLLARVRVCSL